eukprot:COSAG06_NODE_30001_length_546_cov_4.959732_1_plen_24_part_01
MFVSETLMFRIGKACIALSGQKCP